MPAAETMAGNGCAARQRCPHSRRVGTISPARPLPQANVDSSNPEYEREWPGGRWRDFCPYSAEAWRCDADKPSRCFEWDFLGSRPASVQVPRSSGADATEKVVFETGPESTRKEGLAPNVHAHSCQGGSAKKARWPAHLRCHTHFPRSPQSDLHAPLAVPLPSARFEGLILGLSFNIKFGDLGLCLCPVTQLYTLACEHPSALPLVRVCTVSWQSLSTLRPHRCGV